MVSACRPPPEARVALSEPGTVAYDERVVGWWYALANGGDLWLWQLRITPGKEPTTLEITAVWIGGKNKEPVTWLRAIAFGSDIDGETYYNVRRVAGAGDDYTAPGERPGYILARAKITEPDMLLLCFLHGEDWRFTGSLGHLLKEHGVKSRKVEGQSKRLGKTSYHVLDVTRPELRALLREVPPEKLFKSPVPFFRVGTPLPLLTDGLDKRMMSGFKQLGCGVSK